MSFRAQEIRFFGRFQLRFSVFKATCAKLNSFLSALKTAHSFSTIRKTFVKKGASKPQARKFFLCLLVKFFDSTVSNAPVKVLKPRLPPPRDLGGDQFRHESMPRMNANLAQKIETMQCVSAPKTTAVLCQNTKRENQLRKHRELNS